MRGTSSDSNNYLVGDHPWLGGTTYGAVDSPAGPSMAAIDSLAGPSMAAKCRWSGCGGDHWWRDRTSALNVLIKTVAKAGHRIGILWRATLRF